MVSAEYTVDPRRTDNAQCRPQRSETEKCPEDILAQMVDGEFDADGWLKAWLTGDCTWSGARAYFDVIHEDVEEDEVDMEWMTEEEMLEKWKSKKMVAALMKACVADEAKRVRMHPDLEDEPIDEGKQYKVRSKDVEKFKERLTKATGVKGNANVSMSAAQSIVGRLGVSNAKSNTPKTKSQQGANPEEKEKENEEEAKRKLEEEKAQKQRDLAAARLKASKDPQVQRQKWLKGIAELVVTLANKIDEAAKTELPNNMSVTYKTAFVDALASIKETRTFLEAKRSDHSLRAKLKAAQKGVDDVKKDIKAFDSMVSTYA